MMSESQRVIQGMRDMADWLEQQDPEMAQRVSSPSYWMFSYTEEEWRETNKVLGNFEKSSDISSLKAVATIGAATLRHVIDHDKVCERKVTGTTIVTALRAPEDTVYETVEEEVEIVEWVCPPGWR